MRKLRADALALAALTAVAAASAGGAGCSSTKPTELVPGVSSQVVVPHDLQAVRVTVTANGRLVFDQGYDVSANGTVQLPSTLGVVSGESPSTVVTITVRGYQTPCEMSDDCSQQGSAAVGDTGSRILRRSTQTFVDQRTLFVPMPLTYSCWNTDCGDVGMACKGNQCVDATTVQSALVDFDPSLLDGTDVCFNPQQCFGDKPGGGTNLSIAPLLVDAASCTYAFPAPAPLGLNVRAYYQNFAWTAGAGGQSQPMLKAGGEQEILNEDAVEGFTLISAPDAGNTGSQQLFRLAPGLCKLVQAATNPPPPPPTGSGTFITLSDLRVANLCPPKSMLLPICAGEQTNGPALPTGEVTTDGTCNVGVPLAPTQSALYLLMDHSTVMHGAFGPMGSATALSLSLSDPVFKRTFAAFTFLPGQQTDCTTPSTAFTMPELDFGLAGAVQAQIASKLDGWMATDTAAMPTPLDLQAAMQTNTGAYAHVAEFLNGKELPNIAAAMFFVNRVPDLGNDCSPVNGQPTVQAALESEILAAYNATPSVQTYFVVLDDDAHDNGAPAGALTFFKKVQADLPQAVQVLDATQTSDMQAAQTAAANFSKLVTQLGTCLYDYGLPPGTDPATVEIAYTVPGRGETFVPSAPGCTAATQTSSNGWNIDGGRLRICGQSCDDLRTGILGAAAVALKNNQTAQDVPVTATILCSGTAPTTDAGAGLGTGGSKGDSGSVAVGGSGFSGSTGATGTGGSSSGGSTGAPDAGLQFGPGVAAGALLVPTGGGAGWAGGFGAPGAPPDGG